MSQKPIKGMEKGVQHTERDFTYSIRIIVVVDNLGQPNNNHDKAKHANWRHEQKCVEHRDHHGREVCPERQNAQILLSIGKGKAFAQFPTFELQGLGRSQHICWTSAQTRRWAHGGRKLSLFCEQLCLCQHFQLLFCDLSSFRVNSDVQPIQPQYQLN